MFENPSLVVKLKDEETAKLLVVPCLAAEDICDSFYLLVGSNTTVDACRVLLPSFSTSFPFDYELLVAKSRAGIVSTVADHAF